jgi:hypothetical protein
MIFFSFMDVFYLILTFVTLKKQQSELLFLVQTTKRTLITLKIDKWILKMYFIFFIFGLLLKKVASFATECNDCYMEKINYEVV